jgi:hypothetical protein
MSRFSLLALLLISLFFSCDNTIGKSTSIEKSLINKAEKLPSPYSDIILYRYYIESSMAFGSGFTAIKILQSNKKCDYTSDDFFRFGNDSPFFIRWKSKDTLIVKCLSDGGGLVDKQPFKKEIKKWKDWIFEVEYYTIFAVTAEIIHQFDSYSINDNFISFNSKEDTLIFKNTEVQISLDTNNIYLTQFKIDTFKSKSGLSISHFKFQKTYKKTDFSKQQPFIKVNPN